MDWDLSDSEENPSSMSGSKAVEHFNTLDQTQRFHYLSRILRPQASASVPSPIGTDISFRGLPDAPVGTRIAFSKNLYACSRYNCINRSLLTATLFAQRPLTEDEANAVAYWSAERRNWEISSIQIGAVLMAIHIYTSGRIREVKKRLHNMRPRAALLGVGTVIGGDLMILGMAGIIPVSFRENRRRSMEDARLESLRALVGEEKPRLWFEKFWTPVQPMESRKRPGFWEVFWSRSDGSEWQKLKYAASTFVDPPYYEETILD